MRYMVGTIGQYSGIVILGIGIGIEIAMHADIGFLAITIGSAFFTLATKVKHHRDQPPHWQK